jgi:ferritin-like metal-binding protein YciE
MKLESLEKLFLDQIKDLYSAESQLIRALPKMAKAAESDALREAFEEHLEVTKAQKERLDRIGELIGAARLTGKKCAAMEGLIEEGKEVLEAEGPGPVIDAALIAAAQRVEHYEISAYGTARSLAQHLGYKEAVRLLDETAKEEGDTDHRLTQLAAQEVYPAVSDFLAQQDEEEAATADGKGRSNGRSSKGRSKASAS